MEVRSEKLLRPTPETKYLEVAADLYSDFGVYKKDDRRVDIPLRPDLFDDLDSRKKINFEHLKAEYLYETKNGMVEIL